MSKVHSRPALSACSSRALIAGLGLEFIEAGQAANDPEVVVLS
jgi:hypothetical protein